MAELDRGRGATAAIVAFAVGLVMVMGLVDAGTRTSTGACIGCALLILAAIPGLPALAAAAYFIFRQSVDASRSTAPLVPYCPPVLSDDAVRSWLFRNKLLFGVACGVLFAVALAFAGELGAAVFALVFVTAVFAGALVVAERVRDKG